MITRLNSALKLGLLFGAILIPATLLSADQALYKWVDPDGTMTFSPTPPPKSSGIDYEKVQTGQNKSTARVNKSLSATKKQFAAQRPQPQITPIQHSQPLRSNRKSAHCAELQKRVVSLERLIRTDVSDETMDNAVLQMAKYQASFNQSCNGINR